MLTAIDHHRYVLFVAWVDSVCVEVRNDHSSAARIQAMGRGVLGRKRVSKLRAHNSATGAARRLCSAGDGLRVGSDLERTLSMSILNDSGSAEMVETSVLDGVTLAISTGVSLLCDRSGKLLEAIEQHGTDCRPRLASYIAENEARVDELAVSACLRDDGQGVWESSNASPARSTLNANILRRMANADRVLPPPSDWFSSLSKNARACTFLTTSALEWKSIDTLQGVLLDTRKVSHEHQHGLVVTLTFALGQEEPSRGSSLLIYFSSNRHDGVWAYDPNPSVEGVLVCSESGALCSGSDAGRQVEGVRGAGRVKACDL